MKARYWCVIFFIAGSSLASGPGKNSSIEGLVTLNGLTPLPNVTIGLENAARGTHFEAKTNTSGYYLFEEVRPGPYTIWAEAIGYGCILIPRLIVERGERVHQDFKFVRGKVGRECEPLEKTKPR